jgi:hypothetical protein
MSSLIAFRSLHRRIWPWSRISRLTVELRATRLACSAADKKANRLSTRIGKLDAALSKQKAQTADDQRYIDALEAELPTETITFIRTRMQDVRRGYAIYDGAYDLSWLRDGEQVASAGDGSGACLVVSEQGERRVELGDQIELTERTDV